MTVQAIILFIVIEKYIDIYCIIQQLCNSLHLAIIDSYLKIENDRIFVVE